MKKTVIILSVLLTLGLMGSLYYAFAQFDKAELPKTELADAHQLSYELPDIIMQPIPMVPLY